MQEELMQLGQLTQAQHDKMVRACGLTGRLQQQLA
jgi:hypothetical protein